jgi:hypothetical protein
VRYRTAAAADLDAQAKALLQAPPSPDKTAAVLLLAGYNDVRTAVLSYESKVLMTAYLTETGAMTGGAIEKVLASQASGAAKMLADQLGGFSSTSMLTGASLSPVSLPQVLPDRGLVVNPDASSITASYQPFIGCHDCDQVNTWTSTATNPPLVPIRGNYVDYFDKGAATAYPQFQCFSGTDTFVGVCFGSLKTSVSDADTPNISAERFGVNHREWISAGSAHSGSVSYSVRFGYTPTPSTNWIAVRWWGNNTATHGPIVCTSGGLRAQPIAIEPGSGWQVFAVSPGESLEFASRVSDVPLYVGDTHYAYKIGFTSSPNQTDTIELIEIDDTNAALFAEIDPREITRQVGNNGLLSYVAGIQRAFAGHRWLDPQVPADRAAAETFFKLAILSALSTLQGQPPIFLPPSSPSYPAAPWVERQQFLKVALPVLAYRLFAKYDTNVATLFALTSGLIPRLSLAHKELSAVLKDINNLSAPQVSQFLDSALKVVDPGAGTPVDCGAVEAGSADPLDTLYCLEVAVEGARQAVVDLEIELKTSQDFRCSIMRLYQSNGVSNRLVMHSRPEVLAACAQ